MEYKLDVRKKDGSIPKIYTKQQFLIWKLLREPENCPWSGEIKIANRLLKLFPLFSFWQKYFPGFKVNSLAYFLTKEGKNKIYLDYSKNNLDSGPKIEYDLGEKIGEDKKIIKKRGIRELLDLDYE